MRVRRTFAFVDLSGFTEYTTRHGDEKAIDVLLVFRAIARRVATEEGVRIAKWMGDGAMLVSVNRPNLLAAVIEIERGLRERDCPLGLRAGVASGSVLILEGDDYVSSVVNLAARLCDAAPPNQVFITSDLVEDLPEAVVVHAVEGRHLRGFTSPVSVARVEPLAGPTPAGGGARGSDTAPEAIAAVERTDAREAIDMTTVEGMSVAESEPQTSDKRAG